MNDGVFETEQDTPVAPAPGVLAAARNAAGMTLADAAPEITPICFLAYPSSASSWQ